MGKSLNVLIVEDSEDDALLLVRQLSLGGFEPAHLRVDTGPAMIEALDHRDWDLVLADFSMPRFSAPAALEILRNRGLDLPFIIVSGAIGEETAVEAMRAGAHDYIMKDNLARLVPAINRELAEARVRAERRQIRQALTERQAELAAIFDNSPIVMILVDPDSVVRQVNRAAIELSNYKPGEILGLRSGQVLGCIHALDGGRHCGAGEVCQACGIRKAVQETFQTCAGCFRREATLRFRRNGEITEAHFLVSTTALNVSGKDMVLICLEDVTDRMRAEQQIKTSLREKEMLLQEIHHRVKNNLQVILSLLSLQSKYVEDERTLQMFQESQNRVRSMVFIHEKLYRSKDVSRIDFADYVSNLAANLMHSYGLAGRVKLHVDVKDVRLGVNAAIPCGLIINELVTNSLRHAFPADRRGRVDIALRAEDDRRYVLSVSDDGVGLPADFDFNDCESLGMELVSTLTQQLGGTMKVDQSDGTRFEIAFAEPQDRQT